MVQGVGSVDVEADYLPRVVNCENGGAAFEALKAQAVAARTYLYYKLDRSGSIADGTNDQVYSCGRAPREEHFEAVRQTQGMVLQYAERTIAGFFVAGARNQPAPECRGSTDDPTNTERYVTYNEGRSGDELIQTTLGFVDPANLYNRGCMSQNGGHCLAGQGWGFEDILRFYYGEDIALVQAEGACVMPIDGGIVVEDGGAMVEDGGTTVHDGGATSGDGGAMLGDGGAARGDAGPSVAVTPPPGGGRVSSSGCATGGTPRGGWLLAIVALTLGRRSQRLERRVESRLTPRRPRSGSPATAATTRAQ